MVSGKHKKTLLLCRQAPYAGHLGRAALDAALAAAVFEQDLSVLFMDEGIWQLLPQQNSAQIGRKSIASTLESMPLYDIAHFYVDLESVRARCVDPDQLNGETILLDPEEMPGFLEGFDQVWSF